MTVHVVECGHIHWHTIPGLFRTSFLTFVRKKHVFLEPVPFNLGYIIGDHNLSWGAAWLPKNMEKDQNLHGGCSARLLILPILS